MNSSYPAILPHLSSLAFTKGNGLFLASSNLTRQYWLGQIWYYSEPEKAPNGNEAVAMTQVDIGVNDIAVLSTDAPKAIVGLDSGAVQIREVSDTLNFVGKGHAQEHDDYITSVSVCCDESRGISSSADRRIKVWDLEEFKSISTFTGHADTVYTANAHPSDANIFLSCSQDGRLLLWDLRKGQKPAIVLERFTDGSVPTSVCWQPRSDSCFAVGMECGSLLYRDCRYGAAGKRLKTKLHSRPITKLAFANHRPDWVATAAEDTTATVCQVRSDSIVEMHRERRHRDYVQGLAWHPSTHELYTCGWDTQLLRSTISDVALVEHVKQQVQNMDVVEAKDVTTAS